MTKPPNLPGPWWYLPAWVMRPALALPLTLAMATAERIMGADASTTATLAFFESRVRPLLSDQCFSCHGPEKQKGHLRLDSADAMLAGGEDGPVVVPGHPELSRIIQAVAYTNVDLQMPPKRKLGDRAIADLVQWVKLGAIWPANSRVPESASPAVRSGKEITDQDRSWWAFQPLRQPPTPEVRERAARPANPIDAFVLARLEAKGLSPNPPAGRRELIRRAHFDLIGLPPAPEEIERFVRDRAPDAWERLIERLLALPQYGERWGRHWLDVVRFAQSNGYERDGEKPYAWRYRDYVVRAFNDDKPYDQFIREQIAGDELPGAGLDGIVATGFQRLGVWDDEPDDKRMAEFDELDDILATTGTSFLGLTLGCARCHDHKFDPIPQADYYRLLAFYRNVTLYENARYDLESPNYVPLAAPEKVDAWRAQHAEKVARLQAQLGAGANTNTETKKRVTGEIERAKAEKPPFEWALAVRERGPKPPATHILIRGNAGSPGSEVEPAFLSVLPPQKPPPFAPAPGSAPGSRRPALGEWIASEENPLTARVMVNRIWQHHFGRGLVRTTSDFGRAGTPPTHPQLLDWLASEFIRGGWSIKAMHRIILQSEAYQRSARTDNGKAMAIDPDNDLFWRHNLQRLEAEALRDTMLAVAGQLNLAMGGRGFFPHLSGEVLAGQSRPGLDWELSPAPERSRRSLYAYVRRTMPVPVFEAFDYNHTASPLSERPITTVAPQALILLNDEFMDAQAAAFADRVTREAGPASDDRIRRGFFLAVGREPTGHEAGIARTFLQEQEKAFANLASRITFRPDVPASLSVDYMARLAPGDFLLGPATGWSYHRGRWAGAYEGIRTVERARGPFALVRMEPFANGTVQARLMLHQASESAGLLLRARGDNDELRGYEIALDPRRQRMAMRRHGKELMTLAEAPCAISTGQPVLVRCVASGSSFQIWLNDAASATLAAHDPQPITESGLVGLKTWGAALSLDVLSWQPEGQKANTLHPAAERSPSQRALAAFCLLLLNLNEVVYID